MDNGAAQRADGDAARARGASEARLARKLSSPGATVVGVNRPIPRCQRVLIEWCSRQTSSLKLLAWMPSSTHCREPPPPNTWTDSSGPTGGITVVNVGRGTVIDENALESALNAARVSFAALDVFETEPLPTTSPLWGRDDVLIKPALGRSQLERGSSNRRAFRLKRECVSSTVAS